MRADAKALAEDVLDVKEFAEGLPSKRDDEVLVDLEQLVEEFVGKRGWTGARLAEVMRFLEWSGDAERLRN